MTAASARSVAARPSRAAQEVNSLRVEHAALAAVVLLAAAIRFSTLGVQSFSDDELFTAWLTKMSFGHMLTTVPRSEATPHLFYILEWGSSRLFGFGEIGMRILPALAGTLTIPVLYAIAGATGARRAGVAAAAFGAVNPFLVWYSQEARAYALLILFSALALMFLVHYRKAGSHRALVGWSLSSAFGLATHYFALFLFIPQVVWLLWGARFPPLQRLRAVAFPVLAGLALLPLALHQRSAVGDPGGIGSKSLPHRLAAVPKNFLVGFSIPNEALMVVLTSALALLALSLAIRVQRGQQPTVVVLATLALGVIALPLVIAPLGFDYLTSRNVIAALVPGAVVLGYGFARNGLGLLALCAYMALSVAILVGVANNPHFQRPDWRGAAAALGPARGKRILLFNPPFRNPGPFRVLFGDHSWLLNAAQIPPVREIDVIALLQPKPFGPHLPAPPAGPPGPAPKGFRLVQNELTSSFRLVRFRAGRPLAPSLAELSRLVFPHVPAVLIRQSGE